MPSNQVIFIISCLFVSQTVASQQRDLTYYQTRAHQNNPAVKENIALQQFNTLQNDLTYAQLHKPQVIITGDYLFAPFFFNNGQVISITANPERKAYGYDVGLSNGGLYAAQLNASVPLFTKELISIYGRQTAIQNQLLDYSNKQLLHDVDKTISDQYINIYQWQQQITYQQKIIEMVGNRKVIVEALVQKGLMGQNDYLLLEIEMKQRQYDIQQLNINLSAAFNQLNNTCGINDTTKYELIAPEFFQYLPVERYNYRLKYGIDSANIMVREQVFNTKYRPQLTAFGNTGINAADAARIPHNAGLSAGLHLEIPLYDGGQRKIVAQQNKILLDNLRLYQNQNSILLENNLASLNQQINLTNQSVEMIDSQLSSQETLLQIIKDKVVTGQVSVTDYLNALQDYATSNQNKIQARTNLWLLINQYNYLNW